MTSYFSPLNRLIQKLQCFGKRRYGYLDRSICYVPPGNEPLFMILSPDLYHISVVALPVATAKEALRYAPANFDNSEEGVRFGAYRLDEGRYLLSACPPEPIRKRLEEAGVKPSSIERFVLAQEAFGTDILPIALSDESVLAHSEGVVVRLPSHYVSAPIHHDLKSALENLLPCLSGFKADMHMGGAVTKKTLTITAVLSSLIALNFIFQGLFFYREGERIADEQEQMKVDQNLPETQMELEALTQTWEKKEHEQIKLRKIIAAFGTLSLESNTTEALPPPSAPVQNTAAQNSIVLVPGSNPSEQNLLLVPGSNSSSAAVGTVWGEYLTSLVYENGLINFKILTPSKERSEKVRDAASKILKTNTVTFKETLVEGSVR